MVLKIVAAGILNEHVMSLERMEVVDGRVSSSCLRRFGESEAI